METSTVPENVAGPSPTVPPAAPTTTTADGAATSDAAALVVAAPPCPYPMGEHVRIPKSFTYYTDRYYTQYVLKDCKGVKGNNIRLLLHSNMLCILCLDPSHELVVNRHTMKISSLGHSSQKHLSKNGQQERQVKVQGKKKKNAVVCQKEMNLCFIETECGREYKVPAGIDGSLLEINANLAKYPSLIQRFPTTEGFIAIINPHAKARFDHMERVWTATSGELGEGDDE